LPPGVFYVGDDLRKLGIKRWRMNALDTDEWTSIIKEVKAKLKGRNATGKRRRFIIYTCIEYL
jgi:hypothetical protein